MTKDLYLSMYSRIGAALNSAESLSVGKQVMAHLWHMNQVVSEQQSNADQQPSKHLVDCEKD